MTGVKNKTSIRKPQSHIIHPMLIIVVSVMIAACTLKAQAELPLESSQVSLSAQYRVMYNAANIPGPAETTITNTDAYDFFRQRFRIGLDIHPTKKVGGYAQSEYRSGWGTGPDSTDPRELEEGELALDNVAFNRLEERGLRYACLYTSAIENHTLSAGIVPVSDQFGDVLFSADWDFNVGGHCVGAKQ